VTRALHHTSHTGNTRMVTPTLRHPQSRASCGRPARCFSNVGNPWIGGCS
jgi:hypothetical protein